MAAKVVRPCSAKPWTLQINPARCPSPFVPGVADGHGGSGGGLPFQWIENHRYGQIGLRLQLGQLEEEALEPGALGVAVPSGRCHRA